MTNSTELYLGAVQKAMEAGHQHRFTEIHAEHTNTLYAHNTCGFMLWHRRFLLAYEQMLRSMGPEYAQLTLPYWNYFDDASKQMATKVPCNSLEGCSSFLRDFGGGGESDDAVGQSQIVAGINIEYGTCVANGVAAHACAHSDGLESGHCEGCIMRGHWAAQNKILESVGPDFLTMLNVFNRTAGNADAHGLLSTTVERRYHNAVHNALGGTMGDMPSPFDPIFYGHHSTVDMALFIFNRCRYDPTGKIDIESARRDTTFDLFAGCGDVSKFKPTSTFFSGMGTKYRDFIDAENLGALSYSY
ncbi:TPA: hypothetical protein N0F65_005585 [Lagenidium giganteum]|uniref:Tyrosinase copper-binding domain-containing protein n=1 Tax=Lagenidium giganteum TaxID=4803 RepID=A0AAV2Z294_9STRA|nr:TPA: hypothetical protein N0F65_005585 [Lagenidium giganteum]